MLVMTIQCDECEKQLGAAVVMDGLQFRFRPMKEWLEKEADSTRWERAKDPEQPYGVHYCPDCARAMKRDALILSPAEIVSLS
jgi:ribosomal protein L34E